MDFRKLETSSIQVKARLTNINKFTGRIASAFNFLANEQNIKLTVKNKVKDIHCWFDRDMMEKVINNLLSNAFKFVSHGGEISVIIDQYSNEDKRIQSSFKNPREYPEGFVSIEVSDTGKGMNEEQLNRVFDRFYQADDDDDDNKYYGSGIGLALTKQLVDLHKGEIIVNSKRGKGSSFNVILPLGKDHFNEEQCIEDTCPAEPVEYNQPLFETVLMEDIDDKEKELINNEKTPLILVVEDNDDLRFYIRTCLNEQYCISEANNGLEGREKAFEEIPDLIITDIMMPDLDGYELSSQLKSNEKTSHIPIIMLTALSSEDERIKGYEKGADEYISKPFTTSVLQARIKNIIESREKLKKRYSKSILSDSDEVEVVEQTDKSFIGKAIAFVENNISNSNLGVEEFAKELSLSRTQLYRKIKGLTGQGVTEFIRSVKLKKALIMMKENDYTINEITYKTGFNSQSYFTRCFKEVYGKSPLEYMEELNEAGGV
jgi:DNA-binding response OmpR family regulator